MAQCPSCTTDDYNALAVGESIQCGFYSGTGIYLGSKRITRVPNGWFYDKEFVPDPTIEGCDEVLNVAGGLGE